VYHLAAHLWFTHNIRSILLDISSIKIGPGDSARSHMADEFIYVDEIGEGIDLYIQMLSKIVILDLRFTILDLRKILK
jgi:hypothetical protein